MKRKQIAFFLMVLSVFMIAILPVQAVGTTSNTYSVDENGEMVKTQDAYIPNKTITDLGLSSPEDLFVDEANNLYIADRGNRRIIKYSIDTNTVIAEVKHEKFVAPKGIFVTGEGELYVADTGAKAVFKFNKDLVFEKLFEKPTTPIFEDTNFEPSKIAVDDTGNMYIVGEGVYSGIIQISQANEFLGYFTVNKTLLTPMEAFQKLIFSREQLEKMAPTSPNTFSNIFLDDQGIVYTTTMGSSKGMGVKKHNTSGGNMFFTEMISHEDITDVYVDEKGIIYTSSHTGYINVYSKDGEFIFTFGAPAKENDIAGLFSRLPAIAVDKKGEIWALDGEKGYLQSFEPTDYARIIYQAMAFYEAGDYENSHLQWEEVLRLNQMSILAHSGVGKALLRSQHYEEAMAHFKVSGDRMYYSQAFWEVRNVWIQTLLPVVIISVILLIIAKNVICKLDREKRIPLKLKGFKHYLETVPIIGDFIFAGKSCKKPFDTYYELRKNRKGTVLGATIIYLVGFITYMLYQTSKGYIYQFIKIEDMDINAIVVGFFAILLLFILGNYLVTSINDGLGTFRQVYLIPAYGAIPVIVAMWIVLPLSYVLVENEAFLLTLTMQVGVIWSVGTIFIGLQTVHDYSFKETVKSLIMTTVIMAIVAVMGIIITIMSEQLIQFLTTIGKEMIRNVI